MGKACARWNGIEWSRVLGWVLRAWGWGLVRSGQPPDSFERADVEVSSCSSGRSRPSRGLEWRMARSALGTLEAGSDKPLGRCWPGFGRSGGPQDGR